MPNLPGFIGHIAGITDVVGFHADKVNVLRAAFEEALEDYLATCAKQGRAAHKPASGRLMLRVPPKVHGAALVAAQVSGRSLNQRAARRIGRLTFACKYPRTLA